MSDELGGFLPLISHALNFGFSSTENSEQSLSKWFKSLLRRHYVGFALMALNLMYLTILERNTFPVSSLMYALVHVQPVNS